MTTSASRPASTASIALALARAQRGEAEHLARDALDPVGRHARGFCPLPSARAKRPELGCRGA